MRRKRIFRFCAELLKNENDEDDLQKPIRKQKRKKERVRLRITIKKHLPQKQQRKINRAPSQHISFHLQEKSDYAEDDDDTIIPTNVQLQLTSTIHKQNRKRKAVSDVDNYSIIRRTNMITYQRRLQAFRSLTCRINAYLSEFRTIMSVGTVYIENISDNSNLY